MKQKTRKSVAKRFKLTTKGKLLRGHAYSSHLKRKKSKSRIRRQKEPEKVKTSFEKKLKDLLGASRG
ncbi:MAG TPA: 50S ribosomal protein L35 [Candidatus Nanoarchaeia archaeon]